MSVESLKLKHRHKISRRHASLQPNKQKKTPYRAKRAASHKYMFQVWRKAQPFKLWNYQTLWLRDFSSCTCRQLGNKWGRSTENVDHLQYQVTSEECQENITARTLGFKENGSAEWLALGNFYESVLMCTWEREGERAREKRKPSRSQKFRSSMAWRQRFHFHSHRCKTTV